MYKPTIVIDFDGVIHSYKSKFTNDDVIPDKPVSGAFQKIEEYIEHFNVAVYSTRSSSERGIKAMKEWFLSHGWPQNRLGNPANLMFPTNKPPAVMTIDDRAFCFRGRFPEVNYISNFKPWNKR